MASDQNKINISPIAYIKSLMYFQRFTNDFLDKEEFKIAYGLLRGFIDFDNSINIEDFIPIKEFDKEYVVFEEFDKIFDNLETINKEYKDDEYPEYILGWARNSLQDDIEPTIFDKKNHLFFQTAINPRSFFWIFNFENLAMGEGMKLFRFMEDFKVINISSDLIELNFSYSSDVLFDEIVNLAIDIEEKRKSREILIKGLEEK